MIKKLFVSLMALGITSGISLADTGVSIFDKKGGKTSFDRQSITSIELHPETIEIMDKDGSSVSFNKSEISYILLADSEAGINLPSVDGDILNIRMNDSVLIVTGSQPGTHWIIADLTGKIIKTGSLEDYNAEISVEGLTKGIYIFSLGKESIKIVKK